MPQVNRTFRQHAIKIATDGTSFVYSYSLKVGGLYHVFYCGLNNKILYCNNTCTPYSFQHMGDGLGCFVRWDHGRLERAMPCFKTQYDRMSHYSDSNYTFHHFGYMDSSKVSTSAYILPMKRENRKLIIDVAERQHLIDSERRIS